MRAHENPALDVAICLSRQNGLSLLVYHALSEDYSYSSDRFHSFILQGQYPAGTAGRSAGTGKPRYPCSFPFGKEWRSGTSSAGPDLTSGRFGD